MIENLILTSLIFFISNTNQFVFEKEKFDEKEISIEVLDEREQKNMLFLDDEGEGEYVEVEEMPSDMENKCKKAISISTFWEYKEFKGNICFFKQKTKFDVLGNFEGQAKYSSGKWEDVRPISCGENFDLVGTKCIKKKIEDQENQKPSAEKTNPETSLEINGDYIGSNQSGNFVWGGAMNLAWNEMNENIIKGKISFDTNDSKTLEIAEKFNKGLFTKNDLDEKSYYVKSGFGQNTVSQINKESKEKFPNKSFDDLVMDLKEKDFISYAYFFKEVEYQTEFKNSQTGEYLTFKGKNSQESKLKYFYDGNHGNKIDILKYENDDKFIIKFSLKDEEDEIMVAKGYGNDLENLKKEIKENNKENLACVGCDRDNFKDTFKMPKINLDIHRDYIEMIGKLFKLNNEDYKISAMFENIKFKLDEKGAKVENEGVIGVVGSAIPSEEIKTLTPRNFILDKPFYVLMKRKDSDNPYFILGIKNSEFLEKFDSKTGETSNQNNSGNGKSNFNTVKVQEEATNRFKNILNSSFGR